MFFIMYSIILVSRWNSLGMLGQVMLISVQQSFAEWQAKSQKQLPTKQPPVVQHPVNPAATQEPIWGGGVDVKGAREGSREERSPWLLQLQIDYLAWWSTCRNSGWSGNRDRSGSRNRDKSGNNSRGSCGSSNYESCTCIQKESWNLNYMYQQTSLHDSVVAAQGHSQDFRKEGARLCVKHMKIFRLVTIPPN